MTLCMPADRAIKRARAVRAAEMSQGMCLVWRLDAQSDEDARGASPMQLVSALL